MKRWHDNFGRVSVAALNSEDLVSQTKSCINLYGNLLDKMLSEPVKTWNNTFHVLEVAMSGLTNFSLAVDLAQSIGIFSASSPEYKESKEKLSEFLTATYSNRKIALALHELKRNLKLSPKRKYILECTIMSYAEGFHSTEKKNKGIEVDKQLEKYEANFLANLHKARKEFHVAFYDEKDIVNISPIMKKMGHLKAQKSGFDGYLFNLEDSNYRELMRNCTSREKRKEIYKSYVNLASDKDLNNNEVLRKLIAYRNQKAKISGHANYTNYATSGCGLSDEKTIFSFLKNIRKHFETDIVSYKDLINQYAKEKYNINIITPWDKEFINEQIKVELKTFHELENVTIDLDKALNEIFKLAQNLFDVNFAIDKEYQSWHQDNLCYKVTNANGNILSHLILDIFQRDEKPDGLIYNYLLNSTLKVGKNILPSQQAIIMHLKKDDKKAQLSFRDTEVLMHEFGHALHFLLTQKEYHTHHPHQIENDAIEFPSQWFDRFAQNPKILGNIAFQNGKKIGIKKAKLLSQVETISKPLQYWNQILDSKIDIFLNCRFKPKGEKDFHEALLPIFNEHGEKLHKYNQYQNNQFEHFFMGSSYYGYLWADHMVNLWNDEHKDKPLKEQGEMLIKLFNKATEVNFSDEFNKLVKDPYESDFTFEKPHLIVKDLLTYEE